MNPKEKPDHPDIIALPPLIFLGFVVVSSLLHFRFPLRVTGYWVSLSLGIGAALAAGFLATWAKRVMKEAGTNVRPDKPTMTIVRGGPFRFTRNPLYLSLCLLQLALGFILDGWIPLLCTPLLLLVLHFGVVLREEEYLEAKFGESYLALKRQVRRWM